MTNTGSTEPIFAFCHIEKTAGTTLTGLLRAHFGLRHADVLRHSIIVREGIEAPYFYDAEDLRRDCRIYPKVRSIAGHHVRPCTYFEEFEPRLLWYSFVRNPIARLRSHYLHEVAIRNCDESLPDYLRKFTRDDIMVRKIAGERDLSAAKSIVAEKMRFMGIQEKFDQSLLLMREFLGVPDFSVAYGRARNTAAERVGGMVYALRSRLTRQREAAESATQARARAELERHHGLLIEANSLDQQLYDYVCNEVWPQQVERYGGAGRLAADTEAEMATPAKSSPKTSLALLYRNLVYKPYIASELRRNRRLGVDKTTPARPPEERTPGQL